MLNQILSNYVLINFGANRSVPVWSEPSVMSVSVIIYIFGLTQCLSSLKVKFLDSPLKMFPWIKVTGMYKTAARGEPCGYRNNQQWNTSANCITGKNTL